MVGARVLLADRLHQAVQESSKEQEEEGIQLEETTTWLIKALVPAIASTASRSNDDYVSSLLFCAPIVAFPLFVVVFLGLIALACSCLRSCANSRNRFEGPNRIETTSGGGLAEGESNAHRL